MILHSIPGCASPIVFLTALIVLNVAAIDQAAFAQVVQINNAGAGHNGNPVTITNDVGQTLNGQSNGGNGDNGSNDFLTGTNGDGGGSGGTVMVTTSGTISTSSANSAAVFVQSSGGKGGNGGNSDVGGTPGNGGSGGSGNTVSVTNTAAISAFANGGTDIAAISVGGAGGDGGTCGLACVPGDGGGGSSGRAGAVTITSDGILTTAGATKSFGIYAQSIGGAGGAGGSSTFFYLVGYAAGAQSGGDGGSVNVNVDSGSITTHGTGSSAIYAQSIGGGGGSGGTGIGLFYASGGAGTAGGVGSTVTVNNSADLETFGNQSSGVYAQSVGGGGGAGGGAGGIGVTFGGVGGPGQNGGVVDVHNHGNITVHGSGDFNGVTSATLAAGIFAQSVGGGGGDGGITLAGIANFGGKGGGGGGGASVSVENTATIQTICGVGCTGGTAIFAQSVGGGGGNGGGAFGVLSFGGTGGGGGDGAVVTVNNSGRLTTTSQFSDAIFAQSVGGGGGNGAFAGGIAAIGGSGGEGGAGHTVTVNNNANIKTTAADSAGIFAQSVGGGGGNGGGSLGVGAFVSFALGGKGGAGGNGGTVCINTNNAFCGTPLASGISSIETSGDRSTGILAQSVGGGGGNGGFAFSASVGLYGDVSIGVGGKGGGAGTGGDVFVADTGSIVTGSQSPGGNPGQFSDGIDAESIGGGGGNGGFSIAAGVSTGGAVSASLAGNGGMGNSSGTVIVDTHADVTTYGDQAVAIFARSIGGGGGNGGFAVSVAGSPYASVGLSFGGTGGGGAQSGAVSVDNVGTIQTFGALSNGISAQSIGGGGGNGGFSVAAGISISTGGAASLSFGGGGGSGSESSTVHVGSHGDIITHGPGSIGILAQSIGGGGGNGGFSGAIALSAGAAFSDSFGGGGGTGNHAGAVDVTSTGSITTTQDNAIGIEAQSIGGGGGNGGFSLSAAATLDAMAIGKGKAGDGGTGGYGGLVTVTSNGTIRTSGALAYGILAQSIGGGGGNGSFAIGGALSESGPATGNSVGGNGGTGNFAEAVSVTTNTLAGSTVPGTVISTTGTGAIGILAQSIGGGGGNGGFAINLNASLDDNAGDNTLGAVGAAAGTAGAASDGGIVEVNNNGTIVTTGATAHGIVAQSIGGGGGTGGFAIAGAFSAESNASSNSIGGKGGTGGSGKAVTVTNKGDIHVSGDMADAIIAQSIGGGGGNGGFSVGAALSIGGKSANNTLGGAGGNGGTSGEVDVFNSNVITVGGGHSDGILAQSIGGGGGNGGFSVGASGAVNGSDGANDTVGGSGGNGGNGGIVKVQTFTGSSITTSGLMDHGIQAQSIGGGGGNGGFNISGSFSSDGDAKSSVGGSQGTGLGVGGGGGDSVLVTVDNAGDIDTQKASSIGILAQSIGGGGGNGGFSISAGVSLNGSAAANAVGGTGGNGGNGGQVIVINDGVVHTEDANSIGISAQSIGGGGGNGGFAIAGTFTAGSQATVNSVGGSGGHGGYAVEVDVTNNHSVQVDAAHSTGILAQSIGGGGGNGGFAIGAGISVGSSKGASDTVGGSGGLGGGSGIVNVTNAAGSQVNTDGPMDFGIVAQSIGGGGGNGGFTLSASFSLSGDAKTNVGGSCDANCNNATMGTGSGPGAGGGDANTVTVKNDGLVQTSGASSIGIVAQSIGGGGGTGGFAGSAGVSIDGAAGSNSIGGAGGNGGAGGHVVVINQTAGVVHTLLSNSIGIEAQSIGGGGGNGGFSIAGAFTLGSGALANAVGGTGGNGGIGGQVDVTNDHFVQIDAAHSIGILAQSIGGGGGNGGFAIGAGGSAGSSTGAADTVGGSGGNGGAGGVVNVTTGAGSQVVTAGAMDFGIVAQSIGGGGGNGGFTLSGSFALSGDAKTNVGGSCDAACQIKTGGTGSGVGGGGGDAHKVTVDNFGLVQTDGASSTGIIAQSIGGGGGNGGFAGGLAISTGGNSTSTAIGGVGGAGGGGGEVKVTNESGGFVHTEVANSIGILAQSIGGGGGNGGFAISASGSTGSGSSTTVGGAGGAGGGGGLVTVINHGLVETDQVLSAGIVAQSIGGGGGNGGFSVNGTLSSGSGGMSSGVGGTGGLGGAGGTVVVTNNGAIGAFKDGSIGILAQSIGGGGGSGGFSGAVAIGGSLRNNVGGAGGAGGAGGDVTVTSSGSITTVGANSVAVVAQSIGGGGGAGGFAISVSSGTAPSADLTIGGLAATLPTAGVTGTSGTVIVNIASGTLHTTGQLATAALIQAIGGGGGIGGLVVGDPMTLGAAGSTLKVGGQSPLTGNGTALSPTNSSDIAADMAGSMGLVVQSIGGGGGVGQVAGDYDLANSTLSALVGGSGTLTGIAPLTNDGADTTPSNTANVTTQGDNGIGLLSQSVGGGGGVADFSFGNLTGAAAAIVLDLGGSQTTAGSGTHASFSTQGTALTTGDVAPYAIAQSVGGGGGFAGFVADHGIAVGAGGLTFSLGSSVANAGGAGGSAGLADIVDTAGSITTTGFASPGLVAQSIGGGGGFAGFYNGGTTGVAFSGLQLGSLGGSRAASAVTATSAATILTQKDGSFGVLAQSIGGGGGAAIAAGVSGSGVASIGASNGAGGSGGTVGVTTTAAIKTEGVGAHAIVAQSIGGGGGLFLGVDPTGGLLAPQVQATAGGAGGNGAAVTVTNSAMIATTGAAANGIIAQSIGGGGGFIGSGNVATSVPLTGGFAGSIGGAGSAGTVSVEAAASIVTMGVDSTAIFAQSATSTGRGSAIDVTVDSDALIIGGSGAGHAVRLEGGAANLLDNKGLLTTRAGIDGLTIVGGLGDDAVVNTGKGPLTLGLNDVPGLIVGSVDLGGGANSFDNKATGIFDSGASVKLGAGNLLTNEGLLSPGAYLRVLPTSITGNFAQTASGIYGLDVDFQNHTTDRVNVTDTASVKGVVNVDILNPGLSSPGSHQSTILSAKGGATHSNLALMALSTAVAKYVLTYPNSHEIDLKFSIDFAPSGLTPNQTAVGQAINAIQTARASPNFAPIAAALFYQPDAAALGKIYDSISGEGVAGYEDAAFSQNDLFMSTISRQMDFWRTDDRFDPNAFVAYSPIAHGVAEDPSFVQSRTWRAWISGYGGGAQVAHDYTVGGAGVKAVSEGFSAGLDYQVTPNVILGIAGGAGPSGFNVSDRATSGKIDAAHGAVYSAARWGSYYASGIIGYDSFDVSENRYAAIPGSNLPIVAVPGFSEALHGHFQSDSISSRIETGYRRQYRSFGVTPFAAFQFSALTMHGSTETQANYTPSTIGLVYSNRAIHSLPSFLGAKLETHYDVGNGVMITSWINVSWMHEFNPSRGLTASFIAAPGFPFSVQSANPSRDSARLETGLALPIDQTASLFAGFNGSLAVRSASYAGTGGVRLAW